MNVDAYFKTWSSVTTDSLIIGVDFTNSYWHQINSLFKLKDFHYLASTSV